MSGELPPSETELGQVRLMLERLEDGQRLILEHMNLRFDAMERKFEDRFVAIEVRLGLVEQALLELSNIAHAHTRILDEHTRKLDEHTRILDEHTRRLDEHTRKLDEHTEALTQLREDVRRLQERIEIRPADPRIGDLERRVEELERRVGIEPPK